MRRIVLWSLSTLTVLVLLFGYHTSTSSRMASTPSALAAPVPSAAAPEPGASDETASGGTSDDEAGSGADSGSDAGAGSGSGSGSGADSAASQTYTGEVAQTRWGPVQVAIAVADGTITEVAVPQYPAGNPRDVEINNYALPVLVQATLDAQSAQIDMVSGATVTSEGYVTSLQSALDQAGL